MVFCQRFLFYKLFPTSRLASFSMPPAPCQLSSRWACFFPCPRPCAVLSNTHISVWLHLLKWIRQRRTLCSFSCFFVWLVIPGATWEETNHPIDNKRNRHTRPLPQRWCTDLADLPIETMQWFWDYILVDHLGHRVKKGRMACSTTNGARS